MRGELSTDPKRVWLEVLIIWTGVIGIILGFKLLSFVPLIRENLWGIAGLIFLFVPIEWLYRKKQNLADFGITSKHLAKGLLWAGILALFIFPPYAPAFRWWFGNGEFEFALPDEFWKLVVGNLFLVALPEEVFYRGYVQSRLDQVLKGRVRILGAELGWSVVVTAALFAAGHLVEFRVDKLGTFFPGLVFGWLRARTGSVGGAVAFHALCNIFASVLQASFRV